MSRPAPIPTIARVALALLVLAAIGWQLRLHLAASYSALNFFSDFTNLSNLFAACVLPAATRSGGSRAGECAMSTSAHCGLGSIRCCTR